MNDGRHGRELRSVDGLLLEASTRSSPVPSHGRRDRGMIDSVIEG
jgi:hypothetical protein